MKLSARTVGESLCMSKSVAALSQGPDSECQGPTNPMSAAIFSGGPHSTRGTTSDRTERQVTSEAADEGTGTRTANDAKTGVSIADPLLAIVQQGSAICGTTATAWFTETRAAPSAVPPCSGTAPRDTRWPRTSLRQAAPSDSAKRPPFTPWSSPSAARSSSLGGFDRPDPHIRWGANRDHPLPQFERDEAVGAFTRGRGRPGSSPVRPQPV